MSVKTVKPVLVESYPHAGRGFCQGLWYVEDRNCIIESVGIRGESGLLRYALGDDQSRKFAAIDSRYFGEGVAISGELLYQGTLDGIIFIRMFDKFRQDPPIISAFHFPSQVWGLGVAGNDLLVTDGTETLFYVSLADYTVSRMYNFGYDGLNDFVLFGDYYIFNVYGLQQLLMVRRESNELEAIIDCSELIPEFCQLGDILNGVTVCRDHLLITGKRWSEILEIEVPCL